MTTLHGIEVKVGDKVWDSVRGWTIVVTLYEENDTYQIETTESSFTDKGLFLLEHKLPRLFWQEFVVPAHAFVKPKVLVKKYFVLFECNGRYYTTSNWRNQNFTSKKEFDADDNNSGEFKFISLILESEIEVEE